MKKIDTVVCPPDGNTVIAFTDGSPAVTLGPGSTGLSDAGARLWHRGYEMHACTVSDGYKIELWLSEQT
jgi:hypothetical protein